MRLHYPLNSNGAEDAGQLPWKDGVPSTGVQGSYPGHAIVTDVEAEILAAIDASGQARSGSDLTQLVQAIGRGIYVGQFAGAANALTAALPNNIVFASLLPGTRFTGFVATSNTAGVTGAISGIGPLVAPASVQAPLLRRDGTALQSGDLPVNRLFEIRWDGSAFSMVGSVSSDGGASPAIAALRTLVPIHTEVLTTGNILAYTVSGNTFSISGNQTFVHRGVYVESTSTYAQKSFSFAPNKIYHYRWRFANNAGAFVACDLADPSYNPGGLAEDAAAFDATYDDVPFFRIVVDGSGNATVSPLKAKQKLGVNLTISANAVTRITDGSGLVLIPLAPLVLGWNRRPDAFNVVTALVSATGNTSTFLDSISYYSGTFSDGSGTLVASLSRNAMQAVGVLQTRVASASITASWTTIQSGSA